MLYRTLLTSLVAIAASLQSVGAHPGHGDDDTFHQLSTFQVRQSDPNLPFSAAKFPEVQKVMQGNAQFRQQRDAAKLNALVENGQKPPFALISCSDSRVPESTIFNSEPGTFFVERNIANQYKSGDENAQSVINYGVRVLGVQHIVVMGHYGCGGIAAAIASAPRANIDVSGHIIQSWIGDVRQLYLSSNRTEIVEMRNANQAREARGELVEEPDRREAGFRALVEENVKIQVQRLATSSLMVNLNVEVTTRLNTDGTLRQAEGAREGAAEVGVPPEAEGGTAEEALPLIPVFIHGWVHDIETGEVIDLNISVGPSGFENFVPRPAEGGEGNNGGEGNAGEGNAGEGNAGEGNNGGEQPAEGSETPAEGGAGETPAEGGAGETPAEGGAGETPAASGEGESPAAGETGAAGNEGGAAEGGASEGGSSENASSGSSVNVAVNVVGVHFKPTGGAERRSRIYGKRSQSRRESRSSHQARHDDDAPHEHQARHDDESVAHEHQARHEDNTEHEHQARQYPPPVKMYRRRRSLLSTSN